MTATEIALITVTAFAAGCINAVAGGGSLITFPALLAIGLPSVQASLTNTVALCPGYLGATLAQWRDLKGQRARMLKILPAGAIGGAAGALLLLNTDERSFHAVVPFLILFAAMLLALQDHLRRWLIGHEHREHSALVAAVPVAVGAVYGGYFGAGLGVIFLAVLGIVIGDSLTRLNALKQTMSLVVNVSAAIVFVASGRIDWHVAGVMLAASLGGGALGGAVAARVSPAVLRWVVIVVAVGVAIGYWVK